MEPAVDSLFKSSDPVQFNRSLSEDVHTPNKPRTSIHGAKILGKYDKGFRTGMNQEYLRGSQQSTPAKLFNGFLSRGASVPVKVMQGFGHVAGFAEDVADATSDYWNGQDDPNDIGFLDKTFDNGLSNVMADLDKGLREQFPVHSQQAYAEGNIITKMSTTEFWANDFADGLSFLASAYVPGAAVSKLGAIAGATRAGALAAKGSATLSNAAKATKLGKVMADSASKAARATGVNGLTKSGMFNTVYNTVSEAGFEAKEVNDHVRESLRRKFPKMDEQELNKKAAKAASSTFMFNAAGLILPNAIQSKLFGFTDDVNRAAIRQTARSQGLDVAEKVAAWKDRWNRAKSYGAQGFITEGFWEENMQTSVASYEQRLAMGETEDGWVSGIGSNMLNNLVGFGVALPALAVNLPLNMLGLGGVGADFFGPDPHSQQDEGVSAIVLGGLIGAPFAAFSERSRSKVESDLLEGEQKLWKQIIETDRIAGGKLADYIRVPYKEFGRLPIDEKDPAKGTMANYLNAEGNTELDPVKVQAIIKAQMRDKSALEEQFIANATGDPMWGTYNKHISLMSYVWDLKQAHLTNEDITDLLDRQNKETEEAFPGEQSLSEENITIVKALLEEYDKIDKVLAGKDSFSTKESDMRFDSMLRKSMMYTSAKLNALNAMAGSSAKADEAIATMTEDANKFLEELTNPKLRKKLKKEFWFC